MIVRILLWSLVDSTADVDELRAALLPLDPPSAWLWNEASERFGALVASDGESAADALSRARHLIGREPDLYEEFDALEIA